MGRWLIVFVVEVRIRVGHVFVNIESIVIRKTEGRWWKRKVIPSRYLSARWSVCVCIVWGAII
tara:strand:- start:3701 stop:3889 length:189 start_codon:yes stop_codon:yes gene_type:complete